VDSALLLFCAIALKSAERLMDVRHRPERGKDMPRSTRSVGSPFRTDRSDERKQGSRTAQDDELREEKI